MKGSSRHPVWGVHISVSTVKCDPEYDEMARLCCECSRGLVFFMRRPVQKKHAARRRTDRAAGRGEEEPPPARS